jgi:hypothetical protein
MVIKKSLREGPLYGKGEKLFPKSISKRGFEND